MDGLLEPKRLNIINFMGSNTPRKYIPRFQRPFAWGDDQAQKFLGDIERAMEADNRLYFIGALLCIKHTDSNGAEIHEIVDGQQRLITLSLIFAAAQHLIKNADPVSVKKQMGISADEFVRRMSDFLYCGGGILADEDSLANRPYLVEPSENDKMAFQQIVKNGPGSSIRKHKELVAVYKVAQDFFESKSRGVSGYKYVGNFISFLAYKVNLVSIVISDEVNAYEIFEVLNARGVVLVAVDLIKNKLLSCFGKDDDRVKDAYQHWQRTLKGGCRERSDHMQYYIRCHLQMQNGEKIDPKDLYTAVSKKLDTTYPDKVAGKILHNLDAHCHKFAAMMCATHRLWEEDFDTKTGSAGKIGPVVGYLNDYRVTYTLMFSMLYTEQPAKFVYNAFRILQTFMKRTRAARERFSVMEHYEEQFAKLAYSFLKGKGPKTPKEFFGLLKHIDADGGLVVIPDENFISEVTKRPRMKDAEARAMLLELANYMQREEQTGTLVDNEVTLEHVYPKKPKSGEWQGFGDEDIANMYRNRLGNLTLLEGGRNTTASNHKFADKKKNAYTPDKCGILLTNELCDFSEWTPESIKGRQRRLAELAAEVWSFAEWQK